MQRQTLLEYLDALLLPQRFQDYCPNGLQVEGRAEIQRVVCGVTASQALIDAAVAARADALLVHHGWFWKGEDPRLVGIKRRRLQALIEHDINLIAYHLPLDAHPELGNNAQLARVLDIRPLGTLDQDPQRPGLLWHGELPGDWTAAGLVEHLHRRLHRRPLHLGPAQTGRIRRVAWCTGAAQSMIGQAAAAGVDAYISGEVSEQTAHIARETGVHYLAAGHHATERYGVHALGIRLAAEFGIEQQFVDIDNPV